MYLHDVCLVDNSDLVAVVFLGILEGVLADTSGSDFSNELDTLDDSVDDLVFDARVLSLLQAKKLINFQYSFELHQNFSPCSHEL